MFLCQVPMLFLMIDHRTPRITVAGPVIPKRHPWIFLLYRQIHKIGSVLLFFPLLLLGLIRFLFSSWTRRRCTFFSFDLDSERGETKKLIFFFQRDKTIGLLFFVWNRSHFLLLFLKRLMINLFFCAYAYGFDLSFALFCAFLPSPNLCEHSSKNMDQTIYL